MTIEAFAPAKVNLTLHLTGLRADGYHLLDSLVVFADVGDHLTASPAPVLSLTVGGPKAAGVPTGDSNVALRAAQLLRTLRGVSTGAALHLDKHLPHGGGVGGGSSDAAATIRLLARLWDVPPLTCAEALPLGADIPVCLMAPAPMRMQGIGEVLTPTQALPPAWLVLVNPGIHVPTAAVFKKHDALYGSSPPVREPIGAFGQPFSSQDFGVRMLQQGNDLTKVVAEADFAPIIPTILQRLRASQGCLASGMSGSGSTCWAWFDQRAGARSAADSFADHPDWWVAVARVLGPQDQLIRDTT